MDEGRGLDRFASWQISVLFPLRTNSRSKRFFLEDLAQERLSRQNAR